MKKFKPGILLTSITTLLAFMSVLYISSCNNKAPSLSPTTCENVVCQNASYCLEGTCVCPIGYEDSRCATKVNSKFIGTWQMAEYISGSDHYDSVNQSRQYTLTIDSSSTPTSIFINGLRGNSTYGPITATVDSTKIGFVISSFTPVNNGNFTITGGYGYLAIVKNNRDTVFGTYYTNYRNAQTAVEHDTIQFLMTK